MTSRPPELRAAVVEVTNRCNLRCPCCASDSGRARPCEMSLAEMKGVVRDLAALGCRDFTMLGGEFLLRPDWYDIASEVKDAGMELQLITNGLLVTPEVRSRFKALDLKATAPLAASTASRSAARSWTSLSRTASAR